MFFFLSLSIFTVDKSLASRFTLLERTDYLKDVLMEMRT